MKKYLRTFNLILIDLIGLSIATLFIVKILNIPTSLVFITACTTTTVLSNLAFKSYKQLWRYTSFREIQNVFMANIVAVSCLILLNSTPLINTTILTLFNFYAIFFLYSLGVRGCRRFYVSQTTKQIDSKSTNVNTLIIGAGNAASTLIKHILTDKKNIHVCGILDNDQTKIGTQLHGIPILNAINELETVIQTQKVNQVIIAMPSASKQTTQSIANRLIKLNISFKVVPHIHDMLDATQPISLNTIRIENLIDDKEFVHFKTSQKKEKKRILITGGSGYIGTHLTEMLLADGYQVVLLDNHIYGKHGIEHLQNNENLTIVHGDIANIKDVVKSLNNVDTIIALAAIVGDPACGIDPQETLNLNYEASKVLIETANFYGIQRLVFASSCSVYGMGGDSLLTETSPLNPVSLYAKTRIMSENTLFERANNVSPVILRLSTVFGYSPRMRFDLVVNLLTVKALVEQKFQIFGGNQWRPFIHCKDVAKAFYLAATEDQNKVDRQIFNVGSDKLNHQLKDIGTIITKHVPNASFDILNDNVDERNYRVSFEKIKKTLQFNPSYNLDNGVIEMIEKIQQSPTLQNYKDIIYSNVETIKQSLQRENI